MSDPTTAVPKRKLAQVFSARLRELRAKHGLTQDEVAQQLDCHESAVSRWEGGSRFPTGEDLAALADLMHVSTDFLLGRERQYASSGMALVDMRLLAKLAKTASAEEFDAAIVDHGDQAIWLPVPEGAVLMPVGEAMRETRRVATRFRDSKHADRLFRPHV